VLLLPWVRPRGMIRSRPGFPFAQKNQENSGQDRSIEERDHIGGTP
jgi:hypothetical protein